MALCSLGVLDLISVADVAVWWASMHTFYSCLQEQRWVKFSVVKNTHQENEYVIVYVSIHLYGKIDIWLTSLLLRSVGVSQNEQEVLHMAPSVLMWVDVLLHTFGEFYPRSSRTTHSVTAWNLIGKQRDAPGKFSQTKTTNPKSWKLCRLFFIRNKCWFYFFLSTP